MRLRILIGALALALTGTAAAYQTDPRINQLGSYVAERPVVVRFLSQDEQDADLIFATYQPACYVSADHWEGGNWYFDDHTQCRDQYLVGALDVLYGTPGRSSSLVDEGKALLYVIHESVHMRGNWDGRCNEFHGCISGNEAKTECAAINLVRPVLAHFGIAGQEQHDLYAGALAAHYSMIARNPIYLDPGCTVSP